MLNSLDFVYLYIWLTEPSGFLSVQRMAFNSCTVHPLSMKSLLLQHLWKLTYMRMPSKMLLQHWKISELTVGVPHNCQAPFRLNGLLLILSSLLYSLCHLQFKATIAGSLQTAFVWQLFHSADRKWQQLVALGTTAFRSWEVSPKLPCPTPRLKVTPWE